MNVNPGEPADDTVLVVRASGEDGRTRATIVNYACHPVVMGPLNRLASADWVGAMRRTVEANMPGLCLFIQGTTADINPRKMRWTADNWDEVEEQGQAVGDAVQLARKILSCVARVGQRFGITHVANVLCGSENEQIAARGHAAAREAFLHSLKQQGSAHDPGFGRVWLRAKPVGSKRKRPMLRLRVEPKP